MSVRFRLVNMLESIVRILFPTRVPEVEHAMASPMKRQP